jgi:hypothetical protein
MGVKGVLGATLHAPVVSCPPNSAHTSYVTYSTPLCAPWRTLARTSVIFGSFWWHRFGDGQTMCLALARTANTAASGRVQGWFRVGARRGKAIAELAARFRCATSLDLVAAIAADALPNSPDARLSCAGDASQSPAAAGGLLATRGVGAPSAHGRPSGLHPAASR